MMKTPNSPLGPKAKNGQNHHMRFHEKSHTFLGGSVFSLRMTHNVNDPEILCAADQIYLNHNFDINADKMMPTKESASISLSSFVAERNCQ